MLRTRLGLLLTLLPAVAAGQSTGLLEDDPSRGVTVPPTGAAMAHEAPAVAVNPGGLSHVDGVQLFYLHERSIARNQVIDGLFLASDLFDGVGAGVGLQWIRSTTGLDYRKTSWGLSFGDTALALGASLNVFSSAESAELDGLTSFDLGLSGRPTRHFSYGATVRNLDQPERGSTLLPRRYDLGFAVRPIDERYTLGVDYLFDGGGVDRGRFGYTVAAEVFRGFRLGASVSHGLRPADELLLQLSATIDLPNVGVTYAAGSAPAGLDHVVALRLSSANYRSLTSRAGKIAIFDLDALTSDTKSTTQALLGTTPADPYLRLTRLLEGALRDPDLAGVVLKFDGLSDTGLGKAEELRQAIIRLRSGGKKVVAVLLSANDAEYLAASAADAIYVYPEAALMIDGFTAGTTFLGGTAEKLGIHVDVARVGAFKNAPDAYTRTSMSPEQRQALEAYLDVDVRHFEQAVSQGRRLTVEKVRAAINEGLKTPRRAKELGLVDEVIIPADLDDRVTKLVPGARFQPAYRPRSEREDRWGARPQIALVPIIGDITGGKSQEDPFGLAKTAGAQTVVRAIERAAKDDDVAAIVLRIDSPGGSGMASDLIYRAVVEAKKKKPVVCSMGDVAASGGYMAAMAAHEIFAEPTTITGSIGIFFIKPSGQELLSKLGARHESVTRGELAGLVTPFRPWTAQEQAAAQKWVDAFYDDFITEVAASRRLPKAKVDEIARGRVWAGVDAKARGLVDTMGGLLDAIDSARKRAGIPRGQDVDLRIVGERGGLFASGVAEAAVGRLLGDTEAARPLPESIQRMAVELGLSQLLLDGSGLRAQMDYSLTVR